MGGGLVHRQVAELIDHQHAQALGIDAPHQFLVMLPYVVTLVALAGLLRRMRPPASLGINYEQE